MIFQACPSDLILTARGPVIFNEADCNYNEHFDSDQAEGKICKCSR